MSVGAGLVTQSLQRVLVALAVLVFAAPAALFGQHALPWHAGDPPPVVAGLRLGANRGAIDSALGGPESVQTLSPGVLLLAYRSRGIAVLYTEADSLAAVYLVSRKAGDVGGVRVGDTKDSVVARWGDPTEADDSMAAYAAGRWVIILRMDSTRSRVAMLVLGRASEDDEAEGPYDAKGDAGRDIADALRESQADHRLVLIDFGANWCLDCLVLERLFGDSTVAGYLRDHFRVVRVDVGRFNRNLDVSRNYGSPIEGGVPAVVVLSPAGVVVASTKDGSLESARSATAPQILRFLQSWVAAAQR